MIAPLLLISTRFLILPHYALPKGLQAKCHPITVLQKATNIIKMSGPTKEAPVDLIQELMQNQQNRIKLFEEKFPEEARRQQSLQLNTIFDKQRKLKLLDYLKSGPVWQSIIKGIKQDSKIVNFLSIMGKEYTIEKMSSTMLKKLEAKAKKDEQPLTFYNQYAALDKEINHCFIPKKNFDSGEKIKEQTFRPIRVNMLPCVHQGCSKILANPAGHSSHIKTCKHRKKNDADVEQAPERRTRRERNDKTRGIQKEQKK